MLSQYLNLAHHISFPNWSVKKKMKLSQLQVNALQFVLSLYKHLSQMKCKQSFLFISQTTCRNVYLWYTDKCLLHNYL